MGIELWGPAGVTPVAFYSSGNTAEAKFANWAVSQGWQVTKRGWPDFICRRDGEIMCVEVKDGADTLTDWQQAAARDLTTHGIPVYEWRPPHNYAGPGVVPGGQLLPVCDIQHVMDSESLPLTAAPAQVLAAADRAVAGAELARKEAEARHAHAVRSLQASEAKLKTATGKLTALQADYGKLTADAGYLLRHILDCRSHYISTRVRALMRSHDETLRQDIRLLPDGQIATVTPGGTGWPASA